MKAEKNKEKGAALIITLAIIMALASISVASVMVSTADIKRADSNGKSLIAQYTAQAGFEAAIAELKYASTLGGNDPAMAWASIDTMTAKDDDNNDGLINEDDDDYHTTYQDTEFRVDIDATTSRLLGQYTVRMKTTNSQAFARTVLVESTGIVPKGTGGHYARATISGEVTLQFDRSPAFQYCYYMNHFGWMSANANWKYNGNMGCAGVFNWYQSPLEVNGTPQWHDYNETTGKLSYPVKYKPRFEDDAEMLARDAQYDASLKDLPVTGGTIAGYEVLQGENIAGSATTEYPFQPNIGVPSLTKGYFSNTRDEAYENQNYIKVGNTYVCDGVYGDGQLPTGANNQTWRQELQNDGYTAASENSSGNLYLEGTDANPIVLNGSVVIEGNLAIKGKVTGQGALYVRGNAYILDDVTYVNSPDIDTMKTASDQTTIENWIQDNKDADSLGIYSKGTVSIGKYSRYTTHSAVRNWLNAAANESAEAKNGDDGMPNTYDPGEDDPDWNVQLYTAADEANGMIPEGYAVGDAIPGTGEDFDGDGKEDPRIVQDDFRPRGGEDMEDKHTEYETISSTYWGNAPASATTLQNLGQYSINRLDVAVFTNKAFTSWMGPSSGALQWNGLLISRLEAAILGGSWEFNYDRRLMGGGGDLGFDIPRVWKAIEVSSLKIQVN